MKNDKLKFMGEYPVALGIVRLALPAMLGMAVQMLYNLTDTYFIGQTNNPLIVAGISLASPLFFIVQALGNLFAVGSASLVSRQLGAGKLREARETSSVAFYTTLASGLLLTVLLLAFKDRVLGGVGTSAGTFSHANDYFTILAWFTVPMAANIAMAGLLRSEGATLHATVGMSIGLVVNVVLDPIFILGLHMDAAGAAWATVIGHLSSTAYYLWHFVARRSLLSVAPGDFRPSAAVYAETFKIGAPSALSQVVMSGSMLLSNLVASGFGGILEEGGDILVAGIGVYMRVGGLCLSLLMGLTMGYQPFAGFNYGAGKYRRLIRGMAATTLYATGLACAFALLFRFFGREMIRFFINDDATVAAGNMLLQALVWAMPFVGLQLTLTVTFQALGKSVSAMIITLGRQCLFYIPLLFALPRLFGVAGFVFAQPAADVLTTAIAALLSIKLLRMLRGLARGQDELTRSGGPEGDAGAIADGLAGEPTRGQDEPTGA
ncbi:MAG: MATE family efflux transporter [Clostridiales bacterium]|jgi:putative MATE family efflux protein|nr:MATE family efflux transporter [Clostridiales bacterium]